MDFFQIIQRIRGRVKVESAETRQRRPGEILHATDRRRRRPLNGDGEVCRPACSVGWFVSLLVREKVLLASLCERKILFRLKIYDRLRQATAK